MFELLIIARGFCIVIKINMNSSKCSCICTWVALCPSFCWLFFLSLVAYLFNNFPLSFFLFLSFSLCLINIIIIFHTFSRLFTLFFFGCVRRFGECRMCPKLLFDLVRFILGIFFRVVAQQKQHTYTQHKCPQWIIDILRTRAAHLNEHNLRKSVWKGGREASNTYRENRLIYRPEICGTKV